jgi:hypothetical protein
LEYAPIDDWDGEVAVRLSGHDLVWPVQNVERANSTLLLGGITQGTNEIWGDTFWFELVCNPELSCIRYWHDRAVWREDPILEEPT